MLHRIDNAGPMDAEHVYALTERLPYYQGVVRMRIAAEQKQPEPEEFDVPPGTEWVSPEQMLALIS